MTEIDVLGVPEPVVIGATGLVEIAQNVRMILTTTVWSVPLDRDFGLTATVLDQPTPVAMARLSSEVVEKVEKYEPRAKVVAVTFVEDPADAMDGRLVPNVRIKTNETA